VLQLVNVGILPVLALHPNQPSRRIGLIGPRLGPGGMSLVLSVAVEELLGVLGALDVWVGPLRAVPTGNLLLTPRVLAQLQRLHQFIIRAFGL